MTNYKTIMENLVNDVLGVWNFIPYLWNLWELKVFNVFVQDHKQIYNHVYTKCLFLERGKGGYKLLSIDPYQAAY